MGKMSFDELVKEFQDKFGHEWCANPMSAESVVDVFIDFLLSADTEVFDWKRVNNFK